MEHPQNFGFRYRFNDRNYALVVQAESREEAEGRVKAMASAEFLTDLQPQPEVAEMGVVCQV